MPRRESLRLSLRYPKPVDIPDECRWQSGIPQVGYLGPTPAPGAVATPPLPTRIPLRLPPAPSAEIVACLDEEGDTPPRGSLRAYTELQVEPVPAILAEPTDVLPIGGIFV